MNKRPFALVRDAQCVRTVPDDGESIGEALKLAAEHREAELLEAAKKRGETELNSWAKRLLGQLYHLAADAYDNGAMVSIGHSRTDRYQAQSDRLRKKAMSLLEDAPAG